MQFDRRIGIAGLGLTVVATVIGARMAEIPAWIVDIILGVGCILMGMSLGGIFGRPKGHPFGDLLPFIERLCADEHELGLRGRFAFSPDNAQNRVTSLSREDRTRYQAALRGLEGACAPLGLSISVAHIRRGIDAFSPELANVDVSQAYGTLNVISQTLKSELADKYRLAPAA